MRQYINSVELSYKQNLASSTILNEAVSLGSIAKSLKTPGKLVFQLLLGIAMFGLRNPVKTATGATLAYTGLLVPLYNLIQALLHRGIKIPEIIEKINNLELKSTKIDLYMKQFEIVTPAQFAEYLQGAKNILKQGFVSPDGGWLSAGWKTLTGQNAPEEQLANAIYHVGVELGLPIGLAIAFVSWLYSKLKQRKQELTLTDMQKLQQTYPQIVAALQKEVQDLRHDLEIVKSNQVTTLTPGSELKADPSLRLPKATNEMRYLINQIKI
jgi:hypothetical protein